MTTIRQERDRWNKVSGHPAIRLRSQWGSTFNYGGLDSYGTRARTVTIPATRVFIHITVTNYKNYNSNDAHARAIEAIGKSRFPSTGISYNRGCMHNGALYEFQPMGRRGAHTVNDFKRSTCTTTGCPGKGVTNGLTAPSWNLNYNARAYVICQNVNDSVTDAMIDSLAKAIVTDYRAGFITYAAAHNIHGHRCVSSKSCPATPMWNKMWALHTKIHYYIDKGLGGTAPAPSDDDDSGGGTVGIGYDVWSYKGTNITRDAYSYLRGIASDAAASEAAAKANAVTLASIKTALAAQTTTVAALKAVVEQLVAAGPGGTVTAEEIGQIVDTRVQAVIAELDQAEQERAAILASLNTVRAGASAEEVVTELRRQFGLPAEPLPLDTTTPS